MGFLGGGKRHNTDLDDEIAHDLALETEQRIRSRRHSRDAELASRRDFGKRRATQGGIREMWGWTSLETGSAGIFDTLAQPRITRCSHHAVLSLALGIGANGIHLRYQHDSLAALRRRGTPRRNCSL